jgi:hypothetical protein
MIAKMELKNEISVRLPPLNFMFKRVGILYYIMNSGTGFVRISDPLKRKTLYNLSVITRFTSKKSHIESPV